MAPTESIPPNLWAAMAARPIDAMHPHDEQSGFPPNWHGVILCFQVCRQRPGRACEYAILGTLRWRSKLANHFFRHVQLCILPSQLQHLRDRPLPFVGTQDFWHLIADLRREQTEPYFLDFGTGCPEFQELAEVAGPLHHLTGDRAMDRDSLSRDVSQNAVVGCWGAPGIVFGLQTVDRHGDVQVLKLRPCGPHRSERAGDNLHVDSARQERRNHQLQFTIADQRVTTDDRQVQRLDAIDNFKYSIYESLAPSIVQVAQRRSAAEMGVVVRVTAGAFQRAFLGNFDRKRRWFTLQDLAPCLNNFRRVHRCWPFSDRG